MQEFRAYQIGRDGHVLRRIDLFCESEADARERAKLLVDENDVELWQRDRLIVVLKTEQ